MKCILKPHPGILQYFALHFAGDNISDIQQLSNIVNRDLADSDLTWQDLRSNIVVFDFRNEGQSDQDVHAAMTWFSDQGVNIAAIFNTVVDVQQLNYPAVCALGSCIDQGGWFTNSKHLEIAPDTDCDFLCLMRRPSLSRAILAQQLLLQNLNIRMSFGGIGPNVIRMDEYQDMLPGIELPLLLDGPLWRSDPNNREHDVTSPLLRKCAVNIIAETSSQSDPGIWHGIIISEKTFKAFGMCQFPVWWAVPGLVEQVRKMGFDVFDDIINHDYDLVQNEGQRLSMVVAQICKLAKLGPAMLRKEHWPRLEKNRQHLESQIQDQPSTLDLFRQLGILTTS